MVIDNQDNIVYMDADEALSFEIVPTDEVYPDPVELDPDLGLPIVKEVPRPSIFIKYGVHCDPKKNSFHASLHKQYEAKGYLSEKQINALRN